MTSKGKQMRKFSTFKEDAQKIVIKKPWGVEIKSYKAGDPIPAGVKFKIFDAKDTEKIEAYADSLDESADYQKKRFKEPYYMYNESKKVVENKMVGIISLPVGAKFIDDSFGGKRTLEVVKHGNDDVVHVKEVGTGRKFIYDASTPGGNKKVEKIEEAYGFINESFETYIIQDSSSNNKPVYFHYGKYTGYDWGFDKKMATKFSTKEAAERMIEKMRQEGMLINSMKVVSEGRIAKGYENLDAEEKARHLLSHPSSKYMNDLKSENITERAIRKAVKEMLGKPEKAEPEFITNVSEEGEAPAIANTTAEVANPELPLKLKEGENSWEMANGDFSNREPNWRKMKEDLESDKAEALEEYKQAKAKYLSDKSDANWKNYIEKKNVCMALGVRI